MAQDVSSRVTPPKSIVDLSSSLDFVEVGEGRAPYSPSLTMERRSDTSLGLSAHTICFAGNPNPLGHVPVDLLRLAPPAPRSTRLR